MAVELISFFVVKQLEASQRLGRLHSGQDDMPAGMFGADVVRAAVQRSSSVLVASVAKMAQASHRARTSCIACSSSSGMFQGSWVKSRIRSDTFARTDGRITSRAYTAQIWL